MFEQWLHYQAFFPPSASELMQVSSAGVATVNNYLAGVKWLSAHLAGVTELLFGMAWSSIQDTNSQDYCESGWEPLAAATHKAMLGSCCSC